MNVYFPYDKLFAGSLQMAQALLSRGHVIVDYQKDVSCLNVDLVVCRIPNDADTHYRQQALQQTEVLQNRGAVVVNSAASQHTMFDKHATNACLQKQGLPMPAPYDHDQPWPWSGVVTKPAHGSKGEGVLLHRHRQSLQQALDTDPTLVTQWFVPGQTVRVIATKQNVVLAYKKVLSGTGFVTNVAQGATTECFDVDATLAKMAVDAVGAVGATMAGVDFIVGSSTVVLEVNAGFRLPTEFEHSMQLICNDLEALCA